MLFPPGGEREAYSGGRDDLFDLEGAMEFMVQLLRWPLCLDGAALEHHQAPHPVGRGSSPVFVGILAHLLPRGLEGFAAVSEGVG